MEIKFNEKYNGENNHLSFKLTLTDTEIEKIKTKLPITSDTEITEYKLYLFIEDDGTNSLSLSYNSVCDFVWLNTNLVVSDIENIEGTTELVKNEFQNWLNA